VSLAEIYVAEMRRTSLSCSYESIDPLASRARCVGKVETARRRLRPAGLDSAHHSSRVLLSLPTLSARGITDWRRQVPPPCNRCAPSSCRGAWRPGGRRALRRGLHRFQISAMRSMHL